MSKFSTLIIISFFLFCSVSVKAQNCTVNAGVDIQFCPGEQMTLFGNVTGFYNGATITWSQISGPAVTISNTNSLTTTCGIATAGATYVFSITSQCQDGNNPTDNVTYTVVAATPTPPATNAGSTINAGCLQWGNSINLNATVAPPGFIGTWSIVSGGQGSFSSPNSPTSTFTPTQQSPANPSWICPANSNSYVLRWTLVSATPPPPSCPSAQVSTFANVTVNVALFNPIDARAVTPGCGNATANVQLYGTCPGTGTSNWSLISGPAGYTFTSTNVKDVTLTNPPTGTYTFRYTVTGTAPCPTGTKDVTFTVTQGAVFAVTAPNANLGNILTGFCGDDPVPASFQLAANLPNVGETGTWTQIAGGTTVSFSNINDPNAIVTGMTRAGAPYTLRWTITNAGGCSAFNDILFPIVNSFNPQLINGVDNSCTAANYTFGPTVLNCQGTNDKVGIFATPSNVPQGVGWQMTGFDILSKPIGSTIPLGYGGVLSVTPSTSPGQFVVHAAAQSCPSFGLAITQRVGNTIIEFNFYIDIANRSFVGAYTGNIIMKNVYCGSTISVPFAITIGKATSNSNAGTDQNLACGVTSTNLAGNDPLVTAPNYGRGTWQQISGPSTATITDIYNRSSAITNLVPGTYSFSWTINGGTVCPPKLDTVIIRVSAAAPSPVFAGSNQNVCFGTPTSVSATLTVAGDLQTMLANTGSIGTWSLVSQTPGGTPPTITTPSAVSTTVSGLVASTVYVFRFTASNLCGSQTSDVTITTSGTQGPSQADAGASQCLAAAGAINLNAIAPTNGTGTWTKLNVGDPGTITTPGSNTTTVTGVTPNGVYGYVYTVGSIGGCADTKDTVYISNTGPLSAAVARPNLDTCVTGAGNTFQLYATVPVIGAGRWVQTSGPSVVVIANPNSASTLVTLPLTGGMPTNGTYRFNWVVSNGVCPNNTDEVVVNFFSRSSPAVITTLPADLCAPTNGVITLNADVLASGSGTWSIVSGSGTIASPTSNSTSATLNAGINKIRWNSSSLNGAVCPSSYDEVIVTYSPNALARDTGFCKATSTLLKGSHAGIGTGAWSFISGPTSPTITQQGTQDSIASASPLVQGTYVFRYSVTNATCGNSFDDVTVTIDDVANPNAGTDITCLLTGVPIALSGSAIPVGTTALWSRFSAPASASVGTFNTPAAATTNYSTPNVAGTYNFQYQFTSGSCRLSDYVQATVVPSAAAATAAATFCDNATGLNLNGASPSPVTGSWSVVSQPAGSPPLNWTNQNTQNANVKRLTTGTYVFRYTIASYLGCPPTTKDVTVNSICYPLPVTMSNIKVTVQNCDATISWNSYTEQSFKQYIVEESKDGVNFKPLKTIIGKGDNSAYSVTQPINGNAVVYYRVKIINLDNSFSYSNVTSANVNCNKKVFQVYPNPVKDVMNLQIVGYGKLVSINIYNDKGQRVKSLQIQSGSNRVNVNQLANGVYFARIQNENGETGQTKFVIKN